MEITDYLKNNKIIAFSNFRTDDFNLTDYNLIKIQKFNDSILVKNYLERVTNNEQKILDSCKLVNENTDFLSKKLTELSSSEILKLLLIRALLNKDKILIFSDFDKYFMEKDLVFFKRLFKKIAEKYNKTILIFSNDVNFMFDLIEVLYLNTGKNILSFKQDELYNKDIYKYLDKPKIVDFIDYLNSNGKNFLQYKDIKELLKAIYREV